MLIQIMGSIAEFERQQIRERQKGGIAAAKARKEKVYKGRQRGASAKLETLKEKHLEKIKVIQSCLSQGQSINSISKEYNYNRGLIYRLIEKGLV
jgi:DNA invertase Pin-like site-specific DNA recombinase